MKKISEKFTIISDNDYRCYLFDYFNCRDIEYQFLDTSVVDNNLIDVIQHRRETGKDILLILTPTTVVRLIREKSQWNDFIKQVEQGKIKLVMTTGRPTVDGQAETVMILSKFLCIKDSNHGLPDEYFKGRWWPDQTELSIMASLSMDVLCETGSQGEYMRNRFPNWNFVGLSQIFLLYNEWNALSLFSNPKKDKTFFTFINQKMTWARHRSWLSEKIDQAPYSNDAMVTIGRLGDHDKRTGKYQDLYGQFGKFWLDHYPNKAFLPNMEAYDRTYFELVCESLGFHPTDDSFYITEKTFKPVMMEHPFLMVSARHHMRNMRQMGFKTFDGLIDESYDSLEHIKDRIDAIHQQLTKLDMKKSREIYEDSRQICRHNRDHLLNLQGRCKFDLWENIHNYFSSII